MTAQPCNRFVFVSWSWHLSCNGNQTLKWNYRIQCLLKSTFTSLKLNRLYNLKLPVFKFLGEWTNHSENEQIYHPNFVWYVETSSSGDTNPTSCHLTAFELTNQLLYINFPSLEREIFLKYMKSTLPSSVALWFRNLGLCFLANIISVTWEILCFLANPISIIRRSGK